MGAPTAKLETVVITSPIKAVSLFLDLMAVLTLLVCTPTTFWFHADKQTRFGLWTECSVYEIPAVVSKQILIDKSPSTFVLKCAFLNLVWVQLCSALMIVGLACSIISFVLFFKGVSQKEHQERKQKFYRATSFVLIFGAISIILALTIYPAMLLQEIQDKIREDWYIGWSYGCAWGAAIFMVGSFVLLVCDRNREEVFYSEKLCLNEDEDACDANYQNQNQDAKIKTPRQV